MSRSMWSRRVKSVIAITLLTLLSSCDSEEHPPIEANETALPAATATSKWPPMPVAISNNAVAWVRKTDRTLIFSFMGIGSTKSWSDIRRDALVFDTAAREWRALSPVPGRAGRIAATAAGIGGMIYLFGGYEVGEDGTEVSSPAVDILDTATGEWSSGTDIPVPVDDSVSGTYRGRYIYLVSGWSQTGNTDKVQVYDTVDDSWKEATPIPGTPVFGHAGGLVEDTIVYCDGAHINEPGATPSYVATDECWLGSIDSDDWNLIDWRKIDSHPGPARYRSAAGSSSEDSRVYFSGGTDNPYNIDGIGYDGVPSQPVPVTFAWDLASMAWIVINDATPNPTMDHRGLIPLDGDLVRIGGMGAGQAVTTAVSVERGQKDGNES